MDETTADQRPLTEVAVGILRRPDGQVLLAQRPAGKPYAGWWEFPGGKFEPGELAHAAIVRELDEELGLSIQASTPWLIREHAYEHARVRLHFRLIEQWDGEPQSREGQAFGWCEPANAGVSPLLPATVPLMRLLALPLCYAISAAHLLGQDLFLSRLDHALAHGLRLLQLREPGLDDTAFESLFDQVLARCRAHGASLLINSQHPARFWRQADGVHLRAVDVAAAQSSPALARDVLKWIGASCHRPADLEAADAIGADFAVLGPVKETASHPGQRAMAWGGFADGVALTPLPVYAIGGLTDQDLIAARVAGAHGIAMIRSAFGEK